MMRSIRTLLTWAAFFCFMASISMIGCSRHPNEKQLQALEETKQAALSAEAQLEQKRQEKADVENQLAQKKRELDKAQSEKANIDKRLGNM